MTVVGLVLRDDHRIGRRDLGEMADACRHSVLRVREDRGPDDRVASQPRINEDSELADSTLAVVLMKR